MAFNSISKVKFQHFPVAPLKCGLAFSLFIGSLPCWNEGVIRMSFLSSYSCLLRYLGCLFPWNRRLQKTGRKLIKIFSKNLRCCPLLFSLPFFIFLFLSEYLKLNQMNSVPCIVFWGSLTIYTMCSYQFISCFDYLWLSHKERCSLPFFKLFISHMDQTKRIFSLFLWFDPEGHGLYNRSRISVHSFLYFESVSCGTLVENRQHKLKF